MELSILSISEAGPSLRISSWLTDSPMIFSLYIYLQYYNTPRQVWSLSLVKYNWRETWVCSFRVLSGNTYLSCLGIIMISRHGIISATDSFEGRSCCLYSSNLLMSERRCRLYLHFQKLIIWLSSRWLLDTYAAVSPPSYHISLHLRLDTYQRVVILYT